MESRPALSFAPYRTITKSLLLLFGGGRLTAASMASSDNKSLFPLAASSNLLLSPLNGLFQESKILLVISGFYFPISPYAYPDRSSSVWQFHSVT